MESLIDVVTTTFKASVIACVVFTAGYALSTDKATAVTHAIYPLSKRVLLPCQVLIVLAGSTYLTWLRALQIVWPVVVVNAVSHLASALIGHLVARFTSAPSWLSDFLLYNNTSSYPLILILGLALVAPYGDGGLHHLQWRSMDGTLTILSRGTLYIVMNYLVVEVMRTILTYILPEPPSKPIRLNDEEDTADASDDGEQPEATEHTPLVRKTTQISEPPKKLRDRLFSPILYAAILGLLIGLIKPVQRTILGLTPDNQVGNWTWQSIGMAIYILAIAFVGVDILGSGASVKAAQVHEASGEKVPPTLGNVLTIIVWRFGFVPAMIIPLVRAFHCIGSVKAYLQDPVYSFVLSLTVLSPPALPTELTSYSSSVYFSTFYSSLLACLPISVALAFSGRGVSYELNFDVGRALKSAAGGGIAGAAAMVVQVLALMPLRTVMNYQYRYGGGFRDSVSALKNDGGFKRYYAGLGAAIFQGPFSRFGDTAANAGILALLESLTWPVLVKTIAGSFAAACFRMVLTPIDTLKTTQQTKGGKAGLQLLRDRIKAKGIGCLWYGALATAAATFVGNYPWFGTYNLLQDVLPPSHTFVQQLFRQAFIGFCASVVSDTVSNSLRVVKTYRQVHETDVPYMTAAKEIVSTEGLRGLFGRGLKTRILTNGLQGLLFSILWKLFADLIANKGKV